LLPKKKDSTFGLFSKALDMTATQAAAKPGMAAETIREKVAGMYAFLHNRHWRNSLV
jgi:hypothetical protein